jgi:putative transcriptional regulator
VLIGGPVQPERGFVLHCPHGQWESSFKISDSICVTTSRDILVAIAEGRGPERAIVTLGYSGWGAGQIETELKENAWLTAPASETILFETPIEQRWDAAAALVGVNIANLTSYSGRA